MTSRTEFKEQRSRENLSLKKKESDPLAIYWYSVYMRLKSNSGFLSRQENGISLMRRNTFGKSFFIVRYNKSNNLSLATVAKRNCEKMEHFGIEEDWRVQTKRSEEEEESNFL